jgi:hypothetical protein
MARWCLTVRRDRFFATSYIRSSISPCPTVPAFRPRIVLQHYPKLRQGDSYLRDTLLVLSSEEDRPGDTAGVLALEEEGLGLAILETEDLAVTTDVELALYVNCQRCGPHISPSIISPSIPSRPRRWPHRRPRLAPGTVVASDEGRFRTFPG